MRIVILFLVAIILGAISGCSTYKPRSEGFGKMGYEETKLEDGTYKLSYYGSSSDSEEDVKKKWNKRASELCGKQEYTAEVTSKEWTYDNYTILPPLLFKTKGASPLIEEKLACKA